MTGELRIQAQEDLGTIIQSDFGQKIKISRANGSDSKTFIGNSKDIHLALDYETGLLVTGRQCSALMILKELEDFFGEIPKKGWLVEFLELTPNSFRIKDIHPDRSIGTVKLTIGD